LNAVKWVDLIVKDAPYQTQIDVLEQYNCNFCVHGDDISTMSDGNDAYAVVKTMNKYVEVKRTEGISTTDLLYRILKAIALSETKSAQQEKRGGANVDADKDKDNDDEKNGFPPTSLYTSGIIHYVPNALRIAEFMVPGRNPMEGIRAPTSSDTVVYVPGAFDLLHVGHVEFLKKCLTLGSYILVGLHSDETAALDEGRIGPILNTHERLLPLLACRYVNNVIIDAPYVVTENFLDFFKVDIVAIGMHTQDIADSGDPMAVPKQRGIFRQIESNSQVTTRQVIHRIIENRCAYEKRNAKKEKMENMNCPINLSD